MEPRSQPLVHPKRWACVRRPRVENWRVGGVGDPFIWLRTVLPLPRQNLRMEGVHVCSGVRGWGRVRLLKDVQELLVQFILKIK